jgi:uncharacterized protein YceH (UPF0502 family)
VEPLTEEQVRVLGCLVEKEATVPDTYPMTLNALRSACNQSSNRDPVVRFDEVTVQRALDGLKERRVVRFVHPATGERTTKFRHVLDEALDLDRAELAVTALLALRGPQTSGELRTRTERLHPFGSLAEVEGVLEALADRSDPLVRELARRPGDRQARWTLLLAPARVDVAPGPTSGASPDVVPELAGADGGGGPSVAELAARVDELTERMARLERELGIDPGR